MEVIPGIYCLKVPLTPLFPLEHINAYLIQGEKGWLLVDTGWNTPEAFSTLESQIKEAGANIKDISQVVVTHIHPDHYGLAEKIRELSGAKVALHQVESSLIQSRYINMEQLLNKMLQWLEVNGTPEEELPQLQKASLLVRNFVLPTFPEIILKGGERISSDYFNFEVLWTSGHSPGHICLYEPTKKLLLAGDHILPTVTPNVGLYPQSGDNPLKDYLDSLRNLEKLEVDLILPAHEIPFTGLKQRIKELFHHHEERKANIMAALGEGAMVGYQIASGIPWIIDNAIVSFEELSPLDKRLALMETLAHLRLLESEGRVERNVKNGIIFYNAV